MKEIYVITGMYRYRVDKRVEKLFEEYRYSESISYPERDKHIVRAVEDLEYELKELIMFDGKVFIPTLCGDIINYLCHQMVYKKFGNIDFTICIAKDNEEFTEYKIDEDGFIIDWPIGFFEPEY